MYPEKNHYPSKKKKRREKKKRRNKESDVLKLFQSKW